MSKQPDPEKVDTVNPEWAADDFAAARPASDLLAGLFGAEQAAVMLKPRRGRPQAAARKEHVNLRLDPAILEAFRSSGPGWQTRLNAALADWLRSHSPAELAV